MISAMFWIQRVMFVHPAKRILVRSSMSYAESRKLLGIDSSSKLCRKTARDAYFRLAKQCHPDSATDGNADSALFGRLAEAYAKILETDFEQAMESNNETASKSNKALWAKFFYGNIESEIIVDDSLISSILDASKLTSGGLDRGGMWELVHEFRRQAIISETQKEIQLIEETPISTVAIPATRTKKR
jgi:hypothetical protein